MEIKTAGFGVARIIGNSRNISDITNISNEKLVSH